MPYNENEFKARIRTIRNSATLIQDGITDEIVGTEISRDDLIWLLEQADKLENIEKAWREGSGEDIDIALQEVFE